VVVLKSIKAMRVMQKHVRIENEVFRQTGRRLVFAEFRKEETLFIG
jgi:hypothetical protein